MWKQNLALVHKGEIEMKNFKNSLLLYIVITFVANAQSIYKIPVGSSDNSITLKVTNPSNKEIGNISVNLISKPDWITFQSSTESINNLSSGDSKDVIFKFNISESAPLLTEEIINFNIQSSDNLFIQKSFKIEATIPDNYDLLQNFPNPFNPVTFIKFSLPEDKFVNLKLFNILGQIVKVFLNEEKKAGLYTVKFDASSLSSGVYFYSIEAGDFKAVRKMMLMK